MRVAQIRGTKSHYFTNLCNNFEAMFKELHKVPQHFEITFETFSSFTYQFLQNYPDEYNTKTNFLRLVKPIQ